MQIHKITSLRPLIGVTQVKAPTGAICPLNQPLKDPSLSDLPVSRGTTLDLAAGIYRGVSIGSSPGIVGVFTSIATQSARAAGGPIAGLLVGGVTGAMWGVTLSRFLSAALGEPICPIADRLLSLSLGIANGLAGAGGASSPLQTGSVSELMILAAGGGVVGGFVGGLQASSLLH